MILISSYNNLRFTLLLILKYIKLIKIYGTNLNIHNNNNNNNNNNEELDMQSHKYILYPFLHVNWIRLGVNLS
jgi:membrane associated rhomboid family serine protease